MAITRRTFFKGKMNKSVDERVLPDGEYRHAENVLVQNSEGSEEGSVQNSYSNKRLTNINFGTNVITLGNFACEKTDALYWFVVSSIGTFLCEYKIGNNTTSIILKDTRPIGSRVLDIRADKLITGINKIVTDDPSKDLFGWVDDNMEPCCINIERAKTWGENGFEKEDIYLIKAYPKYPLNVLPITIGDSSNHLLTKFLTFSYRYKYLDGEYSAPSDFVNYQFIPKEFELNFYTLDNVGMENSFNAIKITFNTGKRQVTDVQILMKESNSNNIYIIETFNKEKESWPNEIFKNFIFTHNKVYTILPEDELYRTFDNVPLKAKSQTLIGNRFVYGNYVEGRDIVNAEGKKINISFDLSLINENTENNEEFTEVFPLSNQIQFTNPSSFELNQFKKLILSFIIMNGASQIYEGTFYYVLPEDYDTLNDVFSTEEFTDFLELINTEFVANYIFEVPVGFVLNTNPQIVYSEILGIPTFTVTPLLIEEVADPLNIDTYPFTIDSESYLTLNDLRNSTSLKTNRDYQIGIIYMDEFGRKTTVLTCLNNTIFVPQLYSIFKNYLRIRLNSEVPEWANTYKFVVKSQKLDYQTIYVNKYYNEDFYVWAKLEADNKDKVKVGDILIVKKAPEAIIEPIKLKVLELKTQEKNFVTGNLDNSGNEIIEDAGLYMKIRPEGFSMDFNDYKMYQSEQYVSQRYRGNFPRAVLGLFTTTTPTLTEISIPSGSEIKIYFNSYFKYDSGWRNIIYDKTIVAQSDYDTIEEFLNANFINKNMFAYDSFGSSPTPNYRPNVSIQRGDPVFSPIDSWSINYNPAGQLWLVVQGLIDGGSNRRSGYLEARINVRTSAGFYVFETEPSQDIDTNIFYESEEVFDIVDGNHSGNVQNQDFDSNVPAIIDLNFFNCYAQGNGVESYRVRDAFNTKHLNIDLKPTAATIEPYKQVRRFADITYSEPYVESSNLNSLNEFNLSRANFKELDKDHGSIQKLYSRQNDLLVLQEEIASKVLYGKDALYSGDGQISLTSIPSVLGQQILYNGYNGISLNPESFGVNKYQIYYANAKRGTVHRLSIDGDTEISMFGMNDYFRDLFIQKPYAKKLGCFDPYHKQYILSIDEEPIRKNIVNCGNNIILSNLTETYSYDFELNELDGDIILDYNITDGTADIVIIFDGVTTTETDLSGVGQITIPRTTIDDNLVSVQISPSEITLDIEIIHNCPIGFDLQLKTIILSDELDAGKTITNRHKWSTNPDYENEYLLNAGPITLFETETGIEGVGKFPRRGNIVRLESYKSELNTGRLDIGNCNRLGYLVTTSNYTESDLATILAEATFLTITSEIVGTNSFKEFGNFLFNKTLLSEKLYLIWDYTNRKPIIQDDYVSILPENSTINIDVLSNDDTKGNNVITIVTPPVNGTATIQLDNTIEYEQIGGFVANDSFVYQLGSGTCVDTATVYIGLFEGFSITGPDENGCFVVSTGNGSTQTFEYEMGLILVSNVKPFTGLTANSDEFTDTANVATGTQTGSFLVNGTLTICFSMVGAPTNALLGAGATGYFKHISDPAIDIEFEYSYTP